MWSWFLKIVNIGVHTGLNHNQVRLVQFANVSNFVVLSACVAGMIGFVDSHIRFPEDPMPVSQALVPFVQFWASLLVFWLNANRHYPYANGLIIVSALMTVVSLGILFEQNGGDSLYFLLMPLGIFLFLGLNRRAYWVLALAFVSMMGVNYYHNYYAPITPLPEHLIQANYTINLFFLFVFASVMTFFLIRTNQEMESRLTELMQTDSLTGLFNRRKYDAFTKEAHSKAFREQNPISLIVFDVDFFKTYNDTYGHLAGDDCLVRVANALKKTVHRSTDMVARFGGEEFVVVLADTDEEGALKMANSILENVKALEIEHKTSLVSDVVTLSAGLISTVPKNEHNVYDLFTEADQKLYQAKAAGRNQVVA